MIESDKTAIEVSQSSAFGYSDQPKVNIESCVEKLKPGFTRLPNALLMQMVHGNLSRAETKLLLLIARLTISFTDAKTGKEREYCSLSKNVIAAYVGIHSRNVTKLILSLEEKGLIRKIQGNVAEKNQLGLVYEDKLFDVPITPLPAPPSKNAALASGDHPPIGEKSTSNAPKDHQGWEPKCHYPLEAKDHHYKQYRNNNLNNTLSQSDPIPKIIQDYFKEPAPERKQRREWEHFQSLRNRFTLREIETAFFYLCQHGELKTGEKAHSPMAYLSFAMKAVLDRANQVNQAIHKKQNEQNRAENANKEKEAQEKQEEQIFLEKENAFKKTFSDLETRRKYIVNAIRNLPMFSPDGVGAWNLAINKWASETGWSPQTFQAA